MADWLDLCVGIVAPFEGCARKDKATGLIHPYLDTLANPPKPTRGFGRCYNITMESPPITLDEAKAELRAGLQSYAAKLLMLAPALAEKPAALAACTSWAWNVGVGAFKVSRLRRAINDGRWADAVQYIKTPRTAGGVELRGLARRRDAESALMAMG